METATMRDKIEAVIDEIRPAVRAYLVDISDLPRTPSRVSDLKSDGSLVQLRTA